MAGICVAVKDRKEGVQKIIGAVSSAFKHRWYTVNQESFSWWAKELVEVTPVVVVVVPTPAPTSDKVQSSSGGGTISFGLLLGLCLVRMIRK